MCDPMDRKDTKGNFLEVTKILAWKSRVEKAAGCVCGGKRQATEL
jgi:hypothetical protein